MDLNEERVTFALETLKPILDNNEPIIYVDESTFNLWDTKSSSWMPKSRGFAFPVAPSKGKNHTLYMAIGNCLSIPYVHMVTPETTNSQNFTRFIRLIGEHLEENLKVKPHIMYDGHRSHSTSESQEAILDQFTPLRFPKYSSRFNCIEYLFSIIKNTFRK